jgi:hypothetical protein
MFTIRSKPVDRRPTMPLTLSLSTPKRPDSALNLAPPHAAIRSRAALPLRPVFARPTPAIPGTIPFATSAEAWFWTLGALAARRDGVTGGGRRIARPCDPDDVIRAIDLLHRRGGLTLDHARILRRWGDRGIAPDPQIHTERADSRLWGEAMERLEGLLRAKGIVADVVL